MSNSEESSCYCSPRLEVRLAGEKGMGIFAREPIRAGELLLAMGGKILSHRGLAATGHTFSIQIEEDAFMCPIQDEKAYRINHSCTPNAGVSGQITFVALRDITPGEEVCYDYAMTDGIPYDEFECHCGTPNCRHHVTGNDWKLPELWARYGEHFSPYLLRRIHQLQAAPVSEVF